MVQGDFYSSVYRFCRSILLGSAEGNSSDFFQHRPPRDVGDGTMVGVRICQFNPWYSLLGADAGRRRPSTLLVRGTIVNRTYGTPKNLYISFFLPAVFGPINYRPP